MAHFQRERPRVRGTLTMRIYKQQRLPSALQVDPRGQQPPEPSQTDPPGQQSPEPSQTHPPGQQSPEPSQTAPLSKQHPPEVSQRPPEHAQEVHAPQVKQLPHARRQLCPHPSSSAHGSVVQLGVQIVVVVVELVVVVVVVSQTLPVQTCPAGQSPQLSMSGQLPSLMRPHWAPAAVHVVRVQHVPNGLLPGGALFTQTRPQQLWLVRHGCPSALHGFAATALAQTATEISAMMETDKRQNDFA